MFKKNYFRKTILKTWGRNNKGLITVRHKGGGYILKRDILDEKQVFFNISNLVLTIWKTNNSNTFVGLVVNPLNIMSVVRLNNEIKINDILITGFKLPLKSSMRSTLVDIPNGLEVSQLESYPTSGIKYLRSAGTRGQLIKKLDLGYLSLIKMPSGILKKINSLCLVSLGQVSNPFFHLKIIGKAGIKRHMGIRPTVRGVAMNPVDHPHGGGEGKTSGGRCSVSPWGLLSKGKKTRLKKHKKTYSLKFYNI